MSPLLAAALAIVSPVGAAEPVSGTAAAPYTLTRTLVAPLPAADGHVYRLLVSWPEGPPPASGWSVLYLLDGADNFAVTVETARRLARVGAQSGLRVGLIVGIDSGPLARRVLDYTPPSHRPIPPGYPAYGLATGGSTAFLGFVADRVMPWVASRWSVDPRRATLAGHSFGGLLALEAVSSRPGLFAGAAAISPSLWYAAVDPGHASAGLGQRTKLLIAEESEQAGPEDGASARAEALAAELRRKGADARFLPLSGQSHGTTMLAATGAILSLAFGGLR